MEAVRIDTRGITRSAQRPHEDTIKSEARRKRPGAGSASFFLERGFRETEGDEFCPWSDRGWRPSFYEASLEVSRSRPKVNYL
jgi:hypothetical protein